MIYKIHSVVDGQTIYARIDDDGLCRLTCTAEHQEFQQHVKNGAELQDADGNVMSPEAAQQFIATLA
jgi:hypothetical protein